MVLVQFYCIFLNYNQSSRGPFEVLLTHTPSHPPPHTLLAACGRDKTELMGAPEIASRASVPQPARPYDSPPPPPSLPSIFTVAPFHSCSPRLVRRWLTVSLTAWILMWKGKGEQRGQRTTNQISVQTLARCISYKKCVQSIEKFILVSSHTLRNENVAFFMTDLCSCQSLGQWTSLSNTFFTSKSPILSKSSTLKWQNL